MKEQYFTKISKLKKIHASFIGIIFILLLIKLLGVDFFFVDMYYDAKNFVINTQNSLYLLEKVALRNIEEFLVILILLELKHGTKYKYIIISLNTMILFIIFFNIFHISSNIIQMLKMIAIYMPKYINVYIFIMVQEFMFPIIDEYNRCHKMMTEIKSLIKIFVIATVAIVFTSILQSIFLIFLF